MLLDEIFNTNLNIKASDWQSNGRFLLTDFTLNKQHYTIQLERKEILGVKKAAEVSFFVNNTTDGESAFSTTSTQPTSAANVYGIVFHAIFNIADTFDALYFEANRRHNENDKQWEIKSNVYSTLAMKLDGKMGFVLYTTTEPNVNKWFISKNEPNDLYWKSKYQHAQENGKFLESITDRKIFSYDKE